MFFFNQKKAYEWRISDWSSDMCASDLLRQVEIVMADAGAQRRDQGADFLRGQHLVEARAFDIEDLAAQRQHGLVGTMAALLGRAARRVTLDEEEFGLGGIAFQIGRAHV